MEGRKAQDLGEAIDAQQGRAQGFEKFNNFLGQGAAGRVEPAQPPAYLPPELVEEGHICSQELLP